MYIYVCMYVYLSLSLSIYIYIYRERYTCIHIYIYIHIERGELRLWRRDRSSGRRALMSEANYHRPTEGVR